MCQIVHSVLPNPIQSLGGLIAKITTVEITTKKQNEADILAVVRTQLSNLQRLFFSALVGIREVAC